MMSGPTKEYMTVSTLGIDSKATLYEAREQMKTAGLDYCPIRGEGGILGVLGMRDVDAAMSVYDTDDLPVTLFMQRPPYVVPGEQDILTTVREMIGRKTPIAVIADEMAGPLGIFAGGDALTLLDRLLTET